MALSSGSISFDGLASGLSTKDMIATLVEAEKYQANKLEDWKQEWQTKVDVLQEVNTKVASLQTANNALKDKSQFYSRLANSSDSNVASVAVDSTANPGSYHLEVADSTKNIKGSKGWADTNVTAISNNLPASPGTFSFDDGAGNTISVSVDNTMTLDDLKNAIETEISSQGSLAKVEITNDGSSANMYRLSITSAQAGKSGAISIINDDTLLSFTQNSIDDVEEIDWDSSTSTITSKGTYTGSVNKRITFEVIDGGTVGNSDNIDLKWYDSVENKYGTISVNGAGDYEVTQGLIINIGAGDLVKNESFAIDLFVPDIQLGQDTGLAQAEKEMHSGFSDSDVTPVTNTNGTFSYYYAGNEVQAISVSAGSTLQDLVDAINSDPDNPGVTASIINDGTGTANSFHLVLSSNSTGAANTITNISHTLDNFAGNGVSGGGFTETVTATNSMVKIDDYPNGDQYLQNSSNLLTDLVSGASISIQNEGETNITVSNDIDAMVDKVKEFVDTYNDVFAYIDEITKITLDDEDEADTSKSGVLVGNYVITKLESDLKNFIGEIATGFKDGVDPYILLPQVGISSTEDGSLELDETVLREALQSEPDATVDLFASEKKVVSSSMDFSYYSMTSDTNAGTYEFEAYFDGSGNLTGGKYHKDGSSVWYDLTVEDNYLTATDGDAKGLALYVEWDGSSSTQQAELRIKEGKSQTFYNYFNELLDEDTGITKVLIDNYENIMDNIDKRIDRELTRVDQVEARLKEKYANLETTLQTQNSQMEQLQSQLSSLSR